MSGKRFEVCRWRFVATLAVIICVAACGGGAGDEGAKGGTGGSSQDSNGGNSGAGGAMAMGGSSDTAGGSGGTAMAAGSGDSSNQTGGMGGASNTGGMAGMAGSNPPGGGSAGMVDMTKERVWIDADITFGPNGSIIHNQPNNWFSPIDYYNGSMALRADVTAAPSGFYGLELCLYKSGPDDAKHDCLPLAYRLMGTGQILKTHTKASIILRNFLAQGSVTEDDFKTPWAANATRLVGAEHALPISGPVKTHLTIVLVPKGYAFSGWSKYPPK